MLFGNSSNEENLTLSVSAEERLKSFIIQIPREKNSFGNAREMRKTVDLIIKKHYLRIAEIPSNQRTIEINSTIEAEDIPQISELYTLPQEKPIGFKK
jgi:hypothetical protein